MMTQHRLINAPIWTSDVNEWLPVMVIADALDTGLILDSLGDVDQLKFTLVAYHISAAVEFQNDADMVQFFMADDNPGRFEWDQATLTGYLPDIFDPVEFEQWIARERPYARLSMAAVFGIDVHGERVYRNLLTAIGGRLPHFRGEWPQIEFVD